MKQENTNAPDEEALTLWMDGELSGDALIQVEHWAQDHPELLAERDAIVAMNAKIAEHTPSSIEPPYPEFFNQQLLRQIQHQQEVTSNVDQSTTKQSFWKPWLAFPATAAAMGLCFFLGMQTSQNKTENTASQLEAQLPYVYTPDSAVSANLYRSENHDATIILLNGLEEMPDDFNIANSANDLEYFIASSTFSSDSSY